MCGENKCAICSGEVDGVEGLERWQEECMRKDGFYMHFVQEEEGAINAHTHGFDVTFGHKDFQIVFPIPPKVVTSLFWTFRDRLAAGERFNPGDEVTRIIKTFKVGLALAEEGGREVLRVMLPDAEGRLPHEADCKATFKQQETWLGGIKKVKGP